MPVIVPPLPPGTSFDSGIDAPRPRTSGAAIASLVLGILGCVPLISGLLAIVLGIVGIRQTRDPTVTGRGLAVAGIILGILSVMGWVGFRGVLGAGYVESKPARAVARQFLQDVSTANVTGAIANSTGFTPTTLLAQSAQLTALGQLNSFNFQSFNYSTVNGQTTMTLGGNAMYSNGTKACSFTLVKIGGVYKVSSFSVQ